MCDGVQTTQGLLCHFWRPSRSTLLAFAFLRDRPTVTLPCITDRTLLSQSQTASGGFSDTRVSHTGPERPAGVTVQEHATINISKETRPLEMNNSNLLGLIAIALLVGAAPAQSAEPEQTGNPKMPISASPDPQPDELQPAETRMEYGIRPDENPGVANSQYPEAAAPGEAPDQPSSWKASSAIQTDGDVRSMSGGIGASERGELDAMANQFNLHLMFATAGSGEYLSSVQVNILDKRSGPVLTAMSKGPLFYAQLPAGNYSVEVTPTGLRGHDATQRKTIQLDGSGQSRLDFYWQE